MWTRTVIPRDKHCHNILRTDPNFFYIHIELMEEHYLFPQGRRHQVHFPVTLKIRMRKGGYWDDSPKWRPSFGNPAFKEQVTSSFQAHPRPVLPMVWVCIHTIPFHFPPSIPHLPLLLEQASKQQERVTLSAPGEPVRLTIHKVLQSAQRKPAEQTEARRRSALLSNLWGCTEQQQICWQAHVPL